MLLLKVVVRLLSTVFTLLRLMSSLLMASHTGKVSWLRVWILPLLILYCDSECAEYHIFQQTHLG